MLEALETHLFKVKICHQLLKYASFQSVTHNGQMPVRELSFKQSPSLHNPEHPFLVVIQTAYIYYFFLF